jgi:hypothetical protein
LLADIEDSENIGVIESAQDAGFVLKAEKPVGIAGDGRRKDLDCYSAVEAGVTSLVHFAHAAGAKRRLDFIGAEFCARGQGHAWAQL